MKNQDLLDTISVLSFIYGVANYQENLTQSDKDDIMNKLDEQTKSILIEIKNELRAQNIVLNEIKELIKGVRGDER